MRFLPGIVLAAAGLTAAFAQETASQPPRDPDIQRIVAEISPARIEASVRALVSFKTRHTLSSTSDPTTGIGAARNWIRDELARSSRESGGRLDVQFDAFDQPPVQPRLPHGARLVNVVATLPGTKPDARDRVYVVSGHYDSFLVGSFLDAESPAPGANDDASGTAAVLELARVMSKYEFDATIVFMAVAAEEQGLLGSAHWAKEAKAQHRNVAAMITNDIIGNTWREDGSRDRSHLRVFAEGVPPLKELPPEVVSQLQTGGENDFPTRQLARAIQEIAGRYVPELPVKLIYRRDRYRRGGDHSPFLDAGYPAVRFTEPSEVFARQHQPVREEKGVRYGDTIDFVDFEFIASVARVNAAALAELARAPAAPHGVQIDTSKLENDTVLRWEASEEADLGGYRIVWRDTTAFQWEHARDVPKEATSERLVGISKDNVIFGLEAVDQGGHASPAVYPKPRR